MSNNIDDGIKEKAAQCPNNYQCLKDSEFTICPVTDCVEGEILFVEAKHYVICPYMLPFADSNICHCPVRIELYKQSNR